MVNWKKYTIVKIVTEMRSDLEFGSFVLDGYVNYSNKCADYVWCKRVYPYNNFRVGDEIEIDCDLVKYYDSQHHFSEVRIVRNFSPTNIVSVSPNSSSDISFSSSAVNAMNSSGVMDMAKRLSAMVDQSGGRDEFEYKIEVANQDGKMISHSLICRRNKNS